MDPGQPRWGKRREVIASAALKIGKQETGFAREAFDVDRHAARPVRFEFFQTLAKLGDGAMPVALAPMVKADAHLENALVEVANRIGLGDPDILERFMLFEERLPVEFLDAREQGRRRRVLAPAGAPRWGLLDRARQADAWLPTEARTLSPSGEAAGSSR